MAIVSESEHMVLHDQVHQRVTMASLNRNVSQSLFCPVEMASKTVLRTQAYGHYRALVVWVVTCRNLLVFFFFFFAIGGRVDALWSGFQKRGTRG